MAEIHASDTVQINEVMTSNSRLLRDVRGDTPDWVEVRNASDAPVELAGWTLSRGADESHAFVFPARTLSPGECVLIYADSAYTQADGDYHAPFSLRAAGDTLMLFNPAGVAVEGHQHSGAGEKHRLPPRGRRLGGFRRIHSRPCQYPGKPPEHVQGHGAFGCGDQRGHGRERQRRGGRRRHVLTTIYELVNLSSQEVDISAFYLSDSASDSAAWRIPDGTVIPANGYMLFYASGRNEGMHTNFRLASEGEEAVLSNRLGQVLSVVDYDILVENQACSRRADGSYTTDLPPTPGAANE